MADLTNKESDGDRHKVELLKELLKQKIDRGYGLLPRYITAFAIYVAIIGTILKFTFDKKLNPTGIRICAFLQKWLPLLVI